MRYSSCLICVAGETYRLRLGLGHVRRVRLPPHVALVPNNFLAQFSACSCSTAAREPPCRQRTRLSRSRARGPPRGHLSSKFCPAGVGRSTACVSRSDSPAPPRRTPSPSGAGGCSARRQTMKMSVLYAARASRRDSISFVSGIGSGSADGRAVSAT